MIPTVAILSTDILKSFSANFSQRAKTLLSSKFCISSLFCSLAAEAELISLNEILKGLNWNE